MAARSKSRITLRPRKDWMVRAMSFSERSSMFDRRGISPSFTSGFGTVEIPALFQCLVIAALERKAAMWELTKFLLEQEKLGRLTLHQHVPTVFDNPFSPAANEKRMGTPFLELARRGLLLALSGNAHSRKQPLPMPSPYDPPSPPKYSGAPTNRK